MSAFASPVDRIDRVGASSAVWLSTANSATADQGIWQQLKEVFTTPIKSIESFINARENFKTFFMQQMRAIGDSVSPFHQDRLMKQGQGLMQEILASSLNPVMETAIVRGGQTVGEAELRQAIGRAHERAEMAMMEMKSSAVRARMSEEPVPDIRPQIVLGADQSIRVLRPAPRLENLVLRGGGAKGIASAAALTEMANAGVLGGLKTVVGTSVGGLTAVALASGLGVKGLSEITDTLDMNELKAKPKNFEERYPMVDLSWRVGFHGGRSLEILDQMSAKGVAAYLDTHWNTVRFQKKLHALPDSERAEAIARLSKLRKQNFDVDRTPQMITFKDLSIMHRLDPANFKNLVLTGWDTRHDRMSYFRVEDTPDMPVAVAGRISMSFPFVFKSVTYDPGDKPGARAFVDGGVGSNISSEAILSGLAGGDLVEARSRTALMTFDQNGEAYAVMHRPLRERNGLLDWILSKLSGNPDFGRSSRNDDIKLGEAGPNAFVIFHGDIETLDFDAPTAQVEKAKLQSTLKTLEQIEQRQSQAYMVECGSVKECFSMLTEAEKQALRDGGPPSPLSYALRVKDPAYRLQSQLYDMSLPQARAWAAPLSMLV